MGDERGTIGTHSDKRSTGVRELDVTCVSGGEIATRESDAVAGKGIGFSNVSAAAGDGLNHEGWGAITCGLEDAPIGDGDVFSVGDVASAGTESAEGAKGLSRCTTTTTDGLGEECSCVNTSGGDVTGVGDVDSSTGGVANDRAAEDDGVTDGESCDTTATTNGLGKQTDGIVTGGLDLAGAGHVHSASIGGAGAAGTHRDVACDFSAGTTSTTDGLGKESG